MIEVGEYVRTKNGKIDKVINNNYYMPQYIECKKGIVNKENIVKHSKNIIDLIEVGDLINKSEVYELGKTDNGQKWIKACNGILYFENDLLGIPILTKQQYKQNCYTVEREKE